MAGLWLEWDERKDVANRRKHRVSFLEAMTVFSDDNALLLDDPDHSAEEERFILLGLSSAFRLLVVCHTYREGGDVIRLISTRKANRKERVEYVHRGRP